MPKSRPPKKQPRRRPGRPKRGQEIVTPELLEQIGAMWLQGVSPRAIGEAVGVDRMTIQHHLEQTIRPEWHEMMRGRLSEDLAKVALLEKIAWQKFNACEPCESIEQVERALAKGKGGRSRMKITRQATRSVRRFGEAGWLEIVKWAIEFRARVFAHYAPAKHRVDIGGDFRVAGMGPAEVDQAMLNRLLQQITERRNRINGPSAN